MKAHIFPALRLTLFSIIFFSGIYTSVIWLMAQVSPNHGDGEVVKVNNAVVGYARVGQSFSDEKYFQSRPSMVNYNAAGSGGSNKSAGNADHLAMVKARIDTFLLHNLHVEKSQIPVELVTASASGLDPHLSPAAAKIQIARIAKIRNINPEVLDKLVELHIDQPLLGFIGTSSVRLLDLNIALDQLK